MESNFLTLAEKNTFKINFKFCENVLTNTLWFAQIASIERNFSEILQSKSLGILRGTRTNRRIFMTRLNTDVVLFAEGSKFSSSQLI